MGPRPLIVWLRNDLRLDDNPALVAACEAGGSAILVFIWAPDEEGTWALGAASRWWLHHSLAALDRALRQRGSQLIVRRAGPGGSEAELVALAAECGAAGVLWNRRYDADIVVRDATIKAQLRQRGLRADSYNASLLFEAGLARTRQGMAFKVFTPFWRTCLGLPSPATPAPAPAQLPPPTCWPTSLQLEALELLPAHGWPAGMAAVWRPGPEAALARLHEFCDQGLLHYPSERDIPAADGTSRLSPHLRFGELSPRRAWHAIQQAAARSDAGGLFGAAEALLRQLGWREFAYQLLFHFPRTAEEPLRPEYAAFPWREDERALRAWQRGLTGYPIVDAGLRQLWQTGWMHNRVRMIVASFLVKDLLQPWQAGARWFWDTLVDADLANNTLGWQWAAGCGADAAPYFRIFNPVLQGEKFDPTGAYVRRWLPELASLPGRFVHAPFDAPPLALAEAGVRLGKDYPLPLIDHRLARQRALDALAALKQARRTPPT